MEYMGVEKPINAITPVVSVCIQTYQHVHFARKCLDSILQQRTTFEYEIVVGEDESTDGTREVFMEFAQKFPDRIRLFLRSRKDVIYINGQVTGRFNFLENLKASRGRYIALCEGDDYWTDPLKLQKQVDFLESSPGYSFCYHHATWVNEQGQEIRNTTNHETVEATMTLEKALTSGGGSFATASLVFRSECIKDLPNWFAKYRSGDTTLLFLLALQGKGTLLPFTGCCYRIHAGGLNSSVQHNVERKIEWQKDDIKLLNAFDSHTGGKYRNVIQRAKYKHIVKMLRLQNLNMLGSLKFAMRYKCELSVGLFIQLTLRIFAGKYN